MTEEEPKKEEEKPEEKPEDDTPVDIVSEAKAIRDEIKKEKEELKKENDRKQQLKAEELLGSSAGGHVEAEKKEETPQEYAKRMERAELKDGEG